VKDLGVSLRIGPHKKASAYLDWSPFAGLGHKQSSHAAKFFMIKIIGPKDPKDKYAINTTSSSTSWTMDLSPFYLGPVDLYHDFVSKNVENAWQYSKVYKKHLDADGNLTNEYWKWAATGWDKEYADRYPMGKGATPEFCLWDGEKLGYIEARKKVYIPLYQHQYKQTGNLVLFDFDGYDHDALGMSMEDVINCETKKMGHAFVLKMLLETK
jgi:hypothetical protein